MMMMMMFNDYYLESGEGKGNLRRKQKMMRLSFVGFGN